MDAFQTAQSFVTWLLPLGDECSVGPLLPDAVVVQLPRHLLLLIEQVVDVPAHLMVRFEDGPEHLRLALALVGLIFHIAHLLL